MDGPEAGAGFTLAALVVGAMTGCAGTAWPRGEWTKPGITGAAQRHDEYECEREAVRGRGTAAETASVFATCMRARGYERVGP
jgi:hypothetical protein